MIIQPPPGCKPDSIVLTFPVAREFAGQRLDVFIQSRIPRLSRTRAASIVKACAYRRDGSRRRPGERVRAGEIVLLVRERFIEPSTPRDFGVLYEDDWVLAVDKPAGLPMHPTATYHRNTLTFLLRERYGDSPPKIAHRLDRETSGVVLCGKTLDAERALKGAFERRTVHKTYTALVRGHVTADQGEIDVPLGAAVAAQARHPALHVLMQPRPPGEGLVAKTQYLVIDRTSTCTRLQLHPRTGRQHQLRVHLASIGHPIVGDKLYGPTGPDPFLAHIAGASDDKMRDLAGHHRQALHAHRVQLAHPKGVGELTVESPTPPDLLDLWHSFNASNLESC